MVAEWLNAKDVAGICPGLTDVKIPHIPGGTEE
jgi:hypothetical protein